ncbi:MAG: LytTR family DNA-binding domain-containing protein [Bacteroidota bacterium]|nr:LytTR family DNA-binding domain-containing protein [Bacteroidota bacterium]
MDSTNISAIIIDDEPEAIHLLEMYLRFFPNIQVIGKETQAKKGLDLVKQNLPDLVFLDIDMPDMNGLQVADQIHSENFCSEIVFTTAHPKYAYDAIDIQPLDFLIKPFCIEDLEIVIHKFQEKTEKKKFSRKVELFIQSQSDAPKIKLPTTNGVLITGVKDIVMMKSKANNCNLYLQDGTIETITRNLNILAETLNSPALFKISRSTFINLKYLKRVDKKNLKCLISFDHKVLEEDITKSHLLHLEKMDLFPTLSGS